MTAYDMSRVIWRKSSQSGGGNSGTGDCVEVGAAPVAWRKSSRSGAANGTGDNCVEVGSSLNAVGIRDSKSPDAGQLMLSPHDWPALLGAVSESRLPGR